MTSGSTLGELAVRFGCELRGDPALRVLHVAALQDATPDSIAFLANPKLNRHLSATRAGAVVLNANVASECPVPVLIAKNPHATFARIAAVLHPAMTTSPGVHPSAIVDATATIDASASVGPTCVIGANVHVGPRAVIGPGCIVLSNASVGADTRLVARVTICESVQIGERCIFHPGVVIGSDGFGNANDAGRWVKVPQIGTVRIGDDVEVGANTTIDRGAIGDTIIEEGVKLDNQIQIAHNVRIGAHTAMAAGVGIAGSTTIGKHCMFAGKVGVAGQLEICDGVVLMGRATVSGSITKPGSYSGTLGLEETNAFRRNAARFRQLDDMAKQLRRLSNQLAGKAADTPSQSAEFSNSNASTTGEDKTE
jgi:UDP-3-O-[3-hydroxymyristoyl] glucosamine N-acyltransferase